MKRYVVFVLASLSVPSVAWASAWTLPEGTGQWLATLDVSTATEFWEKNGALAPFRTRRFRFTPSSLGREPWWLVSLPLRAWKIACRGPK